MGEPSGSDGTILGVRFRAANPEGPVASSCHGLQEIDWPGRDELDRGPEGRRRAGGGLVGPWDAGDHNGAPLPQERAGAGVGGCAPSVRRPYAGRPHKNDSPNGIDLRSVEPAVGGLWDELVRPDNAQVGSVGLQAGGGPKPASAWSGSGMIPRSSRSRNQCGRAAPGRNVTAPTRLSATNADSDRNSA